MATDMKYPMNKKERSGFFRRELKEYERVTPMTEKERTALREWVAAGNSVHENGSMACYEDGVPCDFLDVYRDEEEIRSDLEKLSPREQDVYLARLRGEDTIDTLLEDVEELKMKSEAYYRVLLRHALEEEAMKMLQGVREEAKAMVKEINGFFLPHEELPF